MKSRTPPTETNMVKYMSRLNEKEQLVICNLGQRSELFKGADVHPGLLPFLPVKDVVMLLRAVAALDHMATYKRTCNEILVKLSEANQPVGTVTFLMRLNVKKVYRQFGRNPERGKPLSLLPKEKVTVGVKWSLPKKKWVPDTNVLVAPCVTLTRDDDISKNGSAVWMVRTLTKCRPAVELWLQQNCV